MAMWSLLSQRCFLLFSGRLRKLFCDTMCKIWLVRSGCHRVSGGQVARFASKKAGGSSKNKHNNSRGKRLGLKCGNGLPVYSGVSRTHIILLWRSFTGEHVVPGNILVRQRGTVYHPGNNVSLTGKRSVRFIIH